MVALPDETEWLVKVQVKINRPGGSHLEKILVKYETRIFFKLSGVPSFTLFLEVCT